LERIVFLFAGLGDVKAREVAFLEFRKPAKSPDQQFAGKEVFGGD